MAETQTRRWCCSAVEDLVSGKLLPWTCAFSAICLLSARIGLIISAAMAISACALLLFILVGLKWCASQGMDSPFGPRLVPTSTWLLTSKFSSTRVTEVLVMAA